MSESNDTRPLPEKGQHHFEWVPDEPLERAIAQAETVYGQRGQAIQSVWDEDVYSSKPVVKAELCNGCGACQPVCPSAPQAIRVARI